MTTAVLAVFAHQGGWDEALLIAGPIALIAGLLWIAKRRLERAVDDQADHRQHPPREG